MARSGTIRIDLSDAILAETIGVLCDKFDWDGYRLHFVNLELRKLANMVTPAYTLAVADDPDDDRILECAVEARSDFIVTEDKDLLRLGSYEGIGILRAADFLNRAQARPLD